MPTLPSACPLDCPDACSLDVTVEGGRVAALDGNDLNPLTHGYICAKVRAFADHVYAKERILHPAVRRGAKGEGRFESVSWDEALDLIAERMLSLRKTKGGEAILPYSYGGSNGLISQDTTDERLFRRLGASRLARTVCAAATGAASQGLYGRMAGVAISDYEHANLIVLWGMNPSASGIHQVPPIQSAIRKGAKIVVVDPRRIRLAERADLHLAIRPGTDLPVALSLIRWFFEEGMADLEFLEQYSTGMEGLRRRASEWTFERAASVAGVEAKQIEQLARLYAETSPAAIRCGWGPERNRNGGSAIAAILALPAVAGKFGRRGGGYTMSNSKIWGFDSTAASAAAPSVAREINMNLLGEELLTRRDPSIDLLFVYNSNALATSPSQAKVRRGLQREDLFTVVFDQVMTDTALYADVVLPATTFLERTEISRGYGAMLTQRMTAVIPPVGESRSNHEVFAQLCRRAGLALPGDPETADEIGDAILRAAPRGDAIKAALDEGRPAFPEHGPAPIQFVDVFPRTSDGRVHLFPEELDREATKGLYVYQEDPATPTFPLAMISPNTDRTVSSSLGELFKGQEPIEMNPADAAGRGIKTGDTVRAWNDLGEVRCLARVSGSVRPGVVQLSKGLWSHNTLNGATSNALSPETLTDLGAGACFNDARVQVERI